MESSATAGRHGCPVTTVASEPSGSDARDIPVRPSGSGGYPPFVEPPCTRVVRRVARTPRNGCHPIKPGDAYLEWTEFPGGEAGYADYAGHPVRMAECGECARRYGRAALLDAS